MNWLLFVVALMIAGSAYAGWRKGFVTIILSIATLLVAVILTIVLTPFVGNVIKNNTDWYSNLKNFSYDRISANETMQSAYGEMDPYSTNITTTSEFDEAVAAVLDKISAPESLKEKIKTDNVSEYLSNGAQSAQNIITDFFATQMANIIFNTVIFAILFIAIRMALFIIMQVLNIVTRIPVVKQMNHMGGLILGMVKGFIYVWLFFIAITLLCSTTFAQSMFGYINSNSVLTYLYDNNLIMKLVFSIF